MLNHSYYGHSTLGHTWVITSLIPRPLPPPSCDPSVFSSDSSAGKRDGDCETQMRRSTSP